MKSTHVISLAAVLSAAMVASSGHDGWGWLLVIAFIAI